MSEFFDTADFFLISFATLPLFFEEVGNFETLPIDLIKYIQQ